MVPLHWSVPVACSGQQSGAGQAAVIDNTGREEVMTKPRSKSGANSGKGRQISSDSDCSPQKPLSKKPMMENQISLQSINDKLDKLVSEQTNFRKATIYRIENVYKKLNEKIITECTNIRDEMYIEVAKMSDRINEVEKNLVTFKTGIDQELIRCRIWYWTFWPEPQCSCNWS